MRRLSRWIKKSTQSRFRKTVSTEKKSVARICDRGSTQAGTTCEACPLPSDQLPVPAEHRFRLNQQRGPGGPWEPARQGGEDESIGRAPADNLHLAVEDADLVAQKPTARSDQRSGRGGVRGRAR